MEMPLSERQLEILRRIVEEYVANGQPVGSKTLIERAGLDISSSTVRAERRHREAVDLAYDDVRASIADRDALDSSRADSPLVEARDAVTVDTTDLGVEQIVDRILELLEGSRTAGG